MSRIFNPLAIGAVALFLLFLALGSPSGANSTGGAPMTMCMDCHGMPKGAKIRVEKLPRAYEPGSIYEISLQVVSRVKSESDTQGGFAVTASDGELIVSDQKMTQKSGEYITHTAEGTLLRSWTFKWKAPPEKKNVTLTISAVAANGDFAPANDAFSRREFIIPCR
jgi:hypothetical protein